MAKRAKVIGWSVGSGEPSLRFRAVRIVEHRNGDKPNDRNQPDDETLGKSLTIRQQRIAKQVNAGNQIQSCEYDDNRE